MKVLENIKNNRILFILFVLILVCILILITRLTQSYFQAQVDDTHVIDADVEADLVDNLEFIEGDPLSLTVNPTTLPQNGSNLTSTSKPKARLTTSSTTSVTYNYYVYFKISNNTFEYTNGTTPEILLTIKNPSNTTITSISGLTYVTQNGVSGFDVTEYNGIIPIASNYAISGTSATSPVTQEWTFTLTFINLSTDQNANMDKTLNTDIIFRKTEMGPLLANVVKNAWVSNSDDSIIIKHDGTVLDGSNNVLDAEDNSYRYTGGDYDVTQTAISAGYNYVNTYYENKTGGVIGVKCNGTNQFVGYDSDACSTKYYYLLYDTNVTQYASYDAAAAQAITDGYLINKNLNNYVCFGYDTSVSANETTCPEQNLYRIIGAFDDDNDGNYNAKLIKADYASTTEFGTNAQNGTSSYSSDYTSSQFTGYYGNQSAVNRFIWYGTSTNSTNRWDNSTFRSGVLNNYYLDTYLGNTWKNMLEEATYYLGGAGQRGYTSYLTKDLYNYERNPLLLYNTSTYPASIVNYIGLMYISDYGYASKTSKWSSSVTTYVRASGNDWLYNGISEWTITPYAAFSNSVFNVYSIGCSYSNPADNEYAVRPVMYLKSTVEVIGGIGSKKDPYYIDL